MIFIVLILVLWLLFSIMGKAGESLNRGSFILIIICAVFIILIIYVIFAVAIYIIPIIIVICIVIFIINSFR